MNNTEKEFMKKGVYFLFFLITIGFLSIIFSYNTKKPDLYFENKIAKEQLELLFNKKVIYFKSGTLKIINNPIIQNFYDKEELELVKKTIIYLNNHPEDHVIKKENDKFEFQISNKETLKLREIELFESGFNSNIIYFENGDLIELTKSVKDEIKEALVYLNLYNKIISELNRSPSYLRFVSEFNAQTGQAELKLTYNPFKISLAHEVILPKIKAKKEYAIPYLKNINNDEIIYLRDSHFIQNNQAEFIMEFNRNFEIRKRKQKNKWQYFLLPNSQISLNGRNISPRYLISLEDGDIISARNTYLYRNFDNIIQESWINNRYNQTSILGKAGNNIIGLRDNRFIKGIFRESLSNEKNEVVLTIFPGLQNKLYSLLSNKSQSDQSILRAGIVIQDQGGKILALAGYPSFGNFNEYEELSLKHWERNFCLEPVPPGSRIKPDIAQAAWGITEPGGKYHLLRVYCPGSTDKVLNNAYLGNTEIDLNLDLNISFGELDNNPHHWVNIQTFLIRSCNIYSANLLNYIYYEFFEQNHNGNKSFTSSDFAKEMERLFNYVCYKDNTQELDHFLFIPVKNLIIKSGNKSLTQSFIENNLLQRIINISKTNTYLPFYYGYLPFDEVGSKDYRTVSSFSIGGNDVTIPLLIMNNNLLRLFSGKKIYPQLIESFFVDGNKYLIDQHKENLYQDLNSLNTVIQALQKVVEDRRGTLFRATSEIRNAYSKYFSFFGKTGTHNADDEYYNTCVSFCIKPNKNTLKLNNNIQYLTVSIDIKSEKMNTHARDLLSETVKEIILHLYPEIVSEGNL